MSVDNLQHMLESNFLEWISNLSNQRRIDALSTNSKKALSRLLKSEINSTPTFDLRDKFEKDLYAFDINLNQIVSEILATKFGVNGVDSLHKADVGFFACRPSIYELENIQETLQKNGYCSSPIFLDHEQLDLLVDGLKKQIFKTKGIQKYALTGNQIFESSSKKGSPPTDDGDTYWLDDMDQLARDPLFIKLAFDPYIIDVATRYLGCPPIHVQTNAWFSFPGKVSKNNLSMNGQLFHQDKEFVKFFKVFIYLSDVKPAQGPHCYIEGSHHDELHLKGVPLSGRVSDNDIGKYYDKNRIKTVVGSAGSILFGDTSCVHKGCAVTSGMRVMLQLEYASSLYLSPTTPFSDFNDPEGVLDQYPSQFSHRLISSYNSEHRKLFQKYHELRLEDRKKITFKGRLAKLKQYLLK
ncbi:phytanoyl-CoA dioxygenase family protein [Polynucleobacter sp. UK-Kesae-W10]|uniref:phytanoyl-CoA dioxygenase family protein n=1 Tax=Polynucleobacter sp. UK-Kesae-W10 TaxID=1819738 RepID=UPI001C0DD838|nr:phytanoyl-CoA dioxygenase family protein [Polynucleobacter sp. UK-Kesae-W10]MBU3576934.1 phytanoyl-CoA dioxygenase family protein [Polynucleobacter sp. UK-Kesae-W10]